MRKPDREILYLVGDSAEKRRLMRSGGLGVARALNDEVSAVCRVQGKDYYVIGEHPFAAFTVWQYMRYERALLSPSPLCKKEAKELLRSVGVRARLGRKLGRLSFVQRRLVTLASRITAHTGTVALNLDGAPYSRRMKSELRGAVRRLGRRYGMWIAVTDSRLVPGRGRSVEIKPSTVFSYSPTKYRSAVVNRRTLLGRIKRCLYEPSVAVENGRVVCVSSRAANAV